MSSWRCISGICASVRPKARRSAAMYSASAHRAAHQAGGAHPVRQPRVVDHVGHLHEAAAFLAHEVGDRALEPDLAARHRARAELVLQAHDAVVVEAAVVEPARQQEERHALHAFGAVLGACEHHRKVGIGVGAEPLVAGEAPAAVGLARGARGGGRDVGTRGLLGHEHRALGQFIEVERGQARQVLGDQVRAAELLQRARERIGHRDRAAQAELGLHEEIGQHVLDQRRHAALPAQRVLAVRDRGQPELAQREALHLDVGRVLDDLLLVEPGARALAQHRRMAVGRAGELVEQAAREAAQALEVRLHVAQQVGRQVEREQLAEARVGGEQVLAVAVGNGMGVRRGLRLGGGRGFGRHRSRLLVSAALFAGLRSVSNIE
ncbi:hypothetical protein M2165_001627 [Variovorax sp. TBS-050B]|nr:hypothetical protein [Variovorax sp. TBS-050B]